MELEFSRQIFEKYSYQFSQKAVQRELSCSVQTDGRTDMTSLILAFRNFAKAPKRIQHSTHTTYLCVLYVSLNKQRLFPNAGLTDLFS